MAYHLALATRHILKKRQLFIAIKFSKESKNMLTLEFYCIIFALQKCKEFADKSCLKENSEIKVVFHTSY
jgi:hypothetical protein